MLYRPILSQLLALNTSEGATDDLHLSFKHDGARACIRSSIQLVNLVHETIHTEAAEPWWWNSLCIFTSLTSRYGLIRLCRCLHRQPSSYDMSAMSFFMGHFRSSERNQGVRQMPHSLGGYLFVQSVYSQIRQSTQQDAPNYYRKATRVVLKGQSQIEP
jgi:hypothetical protein